MKRYRGKTAVERLHESYAVDVNGCWVWQRPLNWAGYGQMAFDGQRHTAHRAAYLLLVGPVPDGMDLDHLCRNRACVNPDHMEPVTRSENLRRGESGGWRRQLTACPKGHPYDETNTYHRRDRLGRECRECQRISRLAYYYRQKEAKTA